MDAMDAKLRLNVRHNSIDYTSAIIELTKKDAQDLEYICEKVICGELNNLKFDQEIISDLGISSVSKIFFSKEVLSNCILTISYE